MRESFGSEWQLLVMGASGSTPASTSVSGKGAGSGKTARRGNQGAPAGGKQSTSSPALKKGPRNYVEVEGVEEDGPEGGKGSASQPVR